MRGEPEASGTSRMNRHPTAAPPLSFGGSTRLALALHAAATLLGAGCAQANGGDPGTSSGASRAEADADVDSGVGLSEGVPLTLDAHFALVYRCPDEAAFVARSRGDSVYVTHELESFTLPPAVAASGARYSDGTHTLWSRGAEARLETPTDTLSGCRASGAGTPWEVASLLGYEFRAVGQEPGWLAEVDDGRRMHVLADYGDIDFFTTAPVAERSGGEIVYRARGWESEVVLRVAPERCQDVMSGEEFPARATLELDGRVLEGCGRSLP